MIWVIIMKLASLCQQLGFHQNKKSRAETFLAFHKDFNWVSFFIPLCLPHPLPGFSSFFRLRFLYHTAIKSTAKFTQSIKAGFESRDFVGLYLEVVSLFLIPEKWSNIKIWGNNLLSKNWQGVMLLFWKKNQHYPQKPECVLSSK